MFKPKSGVCVRYYGKPVGYLFTLAFMEGNLETSCLDLLNL